MLSSLPIMSSAEVEPPPSPSKRAVKRKRKAHQQQSSDSSGSTQHEDDVATLAPPPTTAPTTIRIKTPQRRRLPSILFWINLALANSSTILVALSAVALWLFVSYLRGSLHALVASLLSTPFHLFAYRPSISNQWERLSGSLAPVLAFSCSTVGLGCSSVDRESAVGGAARTARVQAAQALDLFDSVLSLGRSDGGLHHVACVISSLASGKGRGREADTPDCLVKRIWELSVAVQHTSAFQNREFLSGQLQELGDMTRDVKDEVIRLNSQGLNSFTWASSLHFHTFSHDTNSQSRLFTSSLGSKMSLTAPRRAPPPPTAQPSTPSSPLSTRRYQQTSRHSLRLWTVPYASRTGRRPSAVDSWAR